MTMYSKNIKINTFILFLLKQKFCMLQDDLKLYGKYPFSVIKCPSCSRTHNFKKCPFIHYVPDIDLSVKRLNFKSINNRNQNYKRRNPKSNSNSLKNLSKVQISQKRFEIGKMISSELKEKDDSNSDNSGSEEEMKTSNKKTSFIRGYGKFRNNSRSSSIYRQMQRQTLRKKSEEDEKERESLSSIEDLPEKENKINKKSSLDDKSPKFNILSSNSLEEEIYLNALSGVGNFGVISNEINSPKNNRNSVLNASNNAQNMINDKKRISMKREIKMKYFDMFTYDFEVGRDFSNYFPKNNRSEVVLSLKSSLKNSGRKSPQKKKKIK